MSNSHAKLSPSSAERWFACPGSINLIQTLPESAFKSNKYGAEGTVAHQLAEDFVNKTVDLLTLTSRVGETVMQDGFEIEITDAMVEAVIEYEDYIAGILGHLIRKNRPALIVRKAEVRAIVNNSPVYGTCDYLLYRKGDELHVFDFKFGKGVVEAIDNKQGLLYVLGAQDTEAGTAFNEVFFHIVQPRARHDDGIFRSWKIPQNYLARFRVELAEAIARTEDQKALRTAGAWCKFCPALAYCPEAAKGVQGAAQTTFTRLPAPPSKEIGVAQMPEVSRLTTEQLARALDWEDSVDSWFEAVRARALEDLARDPHSVPGYKIVEGRANRQWANEDTVVAAFTMLGDQRFNQKLKSPAQMEKLAGKEEVAKYTVKPQGKPTVAPAGDKREAIPAASQAMEVFGKIVADSLKMPKTAYEVAAERIEEENIFGDLAMPKKKSI